MLVKTSRDIWSYTLFVNEQFLYDFGLFFAPCILEDIASRRISGRIIPNVSISTESYLPGKKTVLLLQGTKMKKADYDLELRAVYELSLNLPVRFTNLAVL